MDTPFQLDKALQGVGELLARRGDEAAIVVVGGTALNLLGVVERYTRDVGVLALATPRPRGEPIKLYAAADDIGTKSRHYQDLVALAPTSAELERARMWVEDQDPSPDIAHTLQRIIALVQTENR